MCPKDHKVLCVLYVFRRQKYQCLTFKNFITNWSLGKKTPYRFELHAKNSTEFFEGVSNGRTHKKEMLSKGKKRTVDWHSSDESAELRVYPWSLVDGQ